MGSVIRLIGIVCSALVLLAFAFFATDEMGRGSQNQQNALASELESTDDPPPVALARGGVPARAQNGPSARASRTPTTC